MNKQEFLAGLRKGLCGLPQDDIEERLSFYGEMIDGRIEEGLLEEEAVSEIGDVEEIVRQTAAEIPLAKIAKERIRPKRRLKAWEIVLLTLGSPIWLSLGIAAAAVILALYISIWALIFSLWAIFASLVAGAVVSIPECVFFAARGSAASGLVTAAAGFICAGLAIFMFFGCKAASKGVPALTKDLTTRIKSCFIKREEA